jgi:uncharacterized protein YbjT (DUF2867 family)
MKKSILVTEVAGAVGFHVAQALLKAGEYHVKILTQKVATEHVLLLERWGAEIQIGYTSDLESLRSALNGCYGVYFSTYFWDNTQQQGNIADKLLSLLSESQVKHIVFSSMHPVKHLVEGIVTSSSGNKFTEHIEACCNQSALPATFMHIGYYYEDYLPFFTLPSANSAATSTYPLPYKQDLAQSAERCGSTAVLIFNNPDEFTGTTLCVTGNAVSRKVFAYA